MTHRAETRCSVVPLSCGSLLTGALKTTDAHRRTLFPKCQTCAATVNCIRPRPLTHPAITHETPLGESIPCAIFMTLPEHVHCPFLCTVCKSSILRLFRDLLPQCWKKKYIYDLFAANLRYAYA